MIRLAPLILTGLLCSTPLMAEGNNVDLSSLIGDMMEDDNSLNYTINLAGKQRMLTQRMSKVVLLISLGIDTKKYSKKLDTFSKLYDQTLNGFKKGDDTLELTATENKDVLKQIDAVEKLWKPFYENIQKVVADGAKAKDAIAFIVKNNEEMLSSSNDLVTAFEKSNADLDYLSKFRLRVVNLAGRQRMLVQKMTKEKLLVHEVKDASYKDKLKKSIELFDSSLTTLINGNKENNISKPTDGDLKAQYDKVSKLWSKLKPLYAKDKLDKKELMVIVDENRELLKEMNIAVKKAETVLEY
jgi:KaiC/GvpD/RAD55 family RecA-like ATPase